VQPAQTGLSSQAPRIAVTLMGFPQYKSASCLLRSKLLTAILQWHRCFINAPCVCGYWPPVYLAHVPPEYTVMGKGAHFRHLEACFHYPKVAEFSMDPSHVHSAHRFASIRFVDLAPKSAVSNTPFLPLTFHLSFSPLITIWAGSFPDPRGYYKVIALHRLIDIFPIGQEVTSPLCW
jgi:hypothetical protein